MAENINDAATAAAAPGAATIVSRSELIEALSQFAKPDTARGLRLLARDYIMYWGLIAALFYTPWLSVKIFAGLLAGAKLTSFYSLAHDAAHRSLVKGRRLNWWMAMILGIPSFQNYRMWVDHHNMIHHPKTNGDHVDFGQPLSKAEYDRLSPTGQWIERFVRAPNIVGLWFEFLFRWLPDRVKPNPRTRPESRASAWKYTAALAVYQCALIALLCAAPGFAPISLAQSLLLGWLLPLCVYCFLSGASLYLMHNHIKLPWFKGAIARSGDYAPELCSIHLKLPAAVSKMINNIYAHSAHHAHAGIPSYRLLEAQKVMDDMLGTRAVVEPLTLANALATMRACKLYDYENHQWLDFDGKPTAPPINLANRGA